MVITTNISKEHTAFIVQSFRGSETVAMLKIMQDKYLGRQERVS